jgi:hypothetical protein
MGEPVKIVDLARDLIELSGLEVDRDIEIVYTGIRPGERLHEELFVPGEDFQPTRHGKISIARNASSFLPAPCAMDAMLSSLEQAVAAGDEAAIVGRLMEILPEFRPGAAPKRSAGRPSGVTASRAGVAVHSNGEGQRLLEAEEAEESVEVTRESAAARSGLPGLPEAAVRRKTRLLSGDG